MNSEIRDDDGDDGVERDLFGMPVLPIRDRRGRPCYRKDQENQQTVALLRARGWSHGRIARYLGCDEKTLRKYFSRELEAGADLVEGQCLEVLYNRMRQGHGPSTRELLGAIAVGHALPPKPEAPKEERLGKKAQADVDARTAHEATEWDGLLREPGQRLN